MTESSDTSVIDEKKTESEGGSSDNDPSYSKFLMSLLIIVFVLIYFSISSYVLYACKIAQSNVLPTDINCSPYTDNEPDIKSIETNIFKTIFSDPPLSMKLNIPYDKYNSKNTILDTLRKYKDSSSSYFLVNYFISIFEALVSKNFAIFNYIFNVLNQIPEVIIVLFGPLILSFIAPFVGLFDSVYVFFYLWFYNMSWFFKKNTNPEAKGKPVWEDVTIVEPISYSCAIALVILFTIVLFATAPYIWFSFISVFFVLFTMISYKGKMNQKDVNIFNIFLDILKFYKIFIISIICFFVTTSAFVNLGIVPGLFSLVVLGCIYFNVIPINLFAPINETNLTSIVSDEQALKDSCTSQNSSSQDTKKAKHGFLYNTIFGEQTGGIGKQLKKINKKMNNR
jgi:hypothetical protein